MLASSSATDEELMQTSRQRRLALIILTVAVFVAVIAPLIAVGLYILATAMFFIHPLIKAKRRS